MTGPGELDAEAAVVFLGAIAGKDTKPDGPQEA
jgi:hypothetical protein